MVKLNDNRHPKAGALGRGKTLFEVKIKHPDRSIYKDDPLVYMMEIDSVTPFKKKKDWTREGYVEEITTNDESIYLTSQLLDEDSLSKFNIENMEKIIRHLAKLNLKPSYSYQN